MKILAIDTATEICSVAILENNEIIIEKTLESVNTHSTALMPLIKETLETSNLKLNDIDLFACDIGPGSFTGIRIGISTIKAFCDSLNKPCIGVTSLEGFAYKKYNSFSLDSLICSLVNANHGNAYCGIYETLDNKLFNQSEEFCDSINEIITKINTLKKDIFFVGNCSILYKDMIQSECILKYNFDINENISAVDIARCAYSKYNSNLYGDSNILVPKYLRRSSAELNRG